MLVLSGVGYSLKMGVFLAITDPWHALFAEALHGICFAPLFAGGVHHMTGIAGPGRRGTAMAAMGLAQWHTAGIIAGLTFGAWTERYGDRAGFWLSMGFAGAGAVLAAVLTAAGVYAPHSRASDRPPAVCARITSIVGMYAHAPRWSSVPEAAGDDCDEQSQSSPMLPSPGFGPAGEGALGATSAPAAGPDASPRGAASYGT